MIRTEKISDLHDSTHYDTYGTLYVFGIDDDNNNVIGNVDFRDKITLLRTKVIEAQQVLQRLTDIYNQL